MSKLWPEMGQRDRRWFMLADAVDAVEEDELKALLEEFGARTPSRRGADALSG